MTRFENAETSVAYETAGTEGDPTALVHGSWAARLSWDRVRPLLSSALRILSYDRRGHGESRGEARPHPVRDDARDLAGLLEATDLYPAHLIGHAYGAAVALRLAIDRPELVRSVAVHEPLFLGLLVDDPATADRVGRTRTDLRRLATELRGGPRDAPPDFLDAFANEPRARELLDGDLRHRPGTDAPGRTEELADPEATDPSDAELSGLDLPVLVTTGERSDPVFRAVSRELGRRLRNATARTLPDTGHWPQLTHPELYAAVLQSFLLERDVPST
jgi:pimeloyl-ACP methyl ester carboxylesterase